MVENRGKGLQGRRNSLQASSVKEFGLVKETSGLWLGCAVWHVTKRSHMLQLT